MESSIDLLRKHPTYFTGMDCAERSWKRPYRLTFVFAQPRSGSTLLMRLMNLACLTPMVGDRPLDFYEGMILTYKGLMHGGQYGQLIVAEDKGEFWDEFRGSSLLRIRYLFKFNAALLFGVDAHRSGASKTTIVGFGNQLVQPMVDMLRDLYSQDRDYELKIIWLKRDHQEILNSFQTRDGPGKIAANNNPEGILDMLRNQEEQFDEAWDLGDTVITYDKLVNDTIATLKKCNPYYDPSIGPSAKAVQQILAKKLR